MEGATCEKCKQSSDTGSLRCSNENLCKDSDRQRLGKQQNGNKIADEVEAEEVGSHLGNYTTASVPSMGLVTTDAECENSMTEEDEGTEPVNEGFLESPPVAGVVKEATQPPAAVINVEDIVNIDETDCEDNSDGDDEADLLIFEESLLKHLEKTNEKGIETIKWNGKISDLKDFVTLLIKEEGKWSSEKISNKKAQIFTQKDSKFTISWKKANKTLDVDGQHKMAGTVRNKINRLITKRDANKTIEVSDTQTEPGEADNYVEHSTSDVKQKKKKETKKRKSKTVKKASNSGVSDTPAEPGEADNYVEHPTSDGEQKKETKKRKSKTAKQAPPVEEMKDFFQQEFNKIWDSLNHVQKAIADLPKNTNTAQMSATIKVSAENKSQASSCDKQEEKTAEGKNKVRQTKSTKLTDYFNKVTCPSKRGRNFEKNSWTKAKRMSEDFKKRICSL